MITNNSFKFNSPTTVILQNNCSLELGNHLQKLGVNKALLVTDSILTKLGVADNIMNKAKEAGIAFEVYNEVKPEPPLENVQAALTIYKETGCNGVVGLGGGSPIDVAKAVAMLAANPGSFEDYVGIDKVPNKCAPLILIPTTSGTGSEVSIFSIIIVNDSKLGVVDANITANIALVDPLLTVSVPRSVTAATGLDAFCHHLESFLSVNSSPLTDAICLEGIRIISQHLREAVGHGGNVEARYWMSYASMLGGLAMNLTEGAAANHGLAFALGAKFHVGHGLSNAVLLPYVFPVIAKAELKKVRRIGEAMGEKLDGLSDREALEAVTRAIRTLVDDVGCLIPLSQFGVTENDLDGLVAETLTQKRVMGHSTYQLTPDEIKTIFQQAL
jgi:alcohol dehydrogenase class IV